MTREPNARRRAWYRVEYAFVTVIAMALKVLPRRAALAIGAAIGQLGWWTRIRRGLVLENLAHALPGLSPDEHRTLGAKAARNFGRTVCEFLRFQGVDCHQVLDLVSVEGLDTLEEALEEGRGAVIVTAHLGAWALYVSALGASGIPSALLVGVQNNPLIDGLIRELPGDAIQLIPKGKTAPRHILRALRANKAVVMVADHYSSDQKVFAPFLGRGAFTLPLPGSLVARHQLPLLCMAGHRNPDGCHRLVIHRLDPPVEGEIADLRLQVATLCNASLGDAILMHPEHYFWYHNRWKMRHRPAPEATSMA